MSDSDKSSLMGVVMAIILLAISMLAFCMGAQYFMTSQSIALGEVPAVLIWFLASALVLVISMVTLVAAYQLDKSQSRSDGKAHT